MFIEPGDFIKVVFKNEQSGGSERMWVKVESADEAARIAFGALDNEPLVNPDLFRGMQLAVSFDNICEHIKAAAFNQ